MTLETQAEFARRIGRDKSHITRLKQSGRLVMREGKVAVDESLRLIDDTESPKARDQANRERLAALREASASESAQEPGSALAEAGRRLKIAQADKAEHEARMVALERARLEGALVAVEDVHNVAIDIASAARASLENLADRYAPELVVAREIDQVHAILSEAIDTVLGELSRKIEGLGQGLKP